MTPIRAFRCPTPTFEAFKTMCKENGKGVSESIVALIDRAIEADETTKKVLYSPQKLLYSPQASEGGKK